MIVYDTFVNKRIPTYRLDKRDSMSDHFSNSVASIITSIVAAIIFWFMFNYIPQFHRKRKIKPIQENYLKQINSHITHLISSLMSPRLLSKELFQDQVITGKLTRAQLEKGLSNKTIIEKDILPPQLSDFLIHVGEEINSTRINIDRLSERALRYPEALNLRTIEILEDICNAIHKIPSKYDNPLGPMFMPMNPSMAINTEAVYKLHCLNLELRKEIFKQNKSSYDYLMLESRYLIAHCQFKKARKLLKKAIKNKDNDNKSRALDYLAISYLIEKGESKTSKRKVEHALVGSSKTHPASGRRNLVSYISKYPEYYSLLENMYSEIELSQVIEILDKEEKLKKEALGSAKKLELLNQNIPF